MNYVLLILRVFPISASTRKMLELINFDTIRVFNTASYLQQNILKNVFSKGHRSNSENTRKLFRVSQR